MGVMIWVGAIVSLIGVGLLIYCIRKAMTLRNEPLDDATMKAALQRLAAVNMAALGISALGLMMVIVGLLLG